MRLALLAILLMIAAPVHAQFFWIPAESFAEHTDIALEGAPDIDDVTGMPIQLLGNGQQVRIQIGLNDDLRQYLLENRVFQVCALVANYSSGETNAVRTRHPDPLITRTHILNTDGYRTVCSEFAPIDTSNFQTAGVRVFPPSPGVVKVRGVSFRGVNTSGTASDPALLRNYEYSRALGYIWGDGSITSDGNSLFFPRRNTRTSNHFGSVAEAFFGDALTQNQQGTRYVLQVNGIMPEEFLTQGISLSDIPDKRAFLTSVVETEGAVLVGRLADDPNRNRCAFIKTLVDNLNPQCDANTCTDGKCETPNCAFIAHGRLRGVADRPGINSNCGVYLSGEASDWRSLFISDDFHFVKTDRTPGGEPTRHEPESRPAYTQ